MEKKAKIIATLGPAIYSNSKLKQLVSLGVDAFRINFSHKTQGIDKIVSRIRKIEKTSNKKLALIASNTKIAGLICSGQDLKSLKNFKRLLKVTPGVKLLDRKDDQKRVSFVHDAINNGANFVVIGRELINAKDPMKLINEYNKKYENKNLWTK